MHPVACLQIYLYFLHSSACRIIGWGLTAFANPSSCVSAGSALFRQILITLLPSKRYPLMKGSQLSQHPIPVLLDSFFSIGSLFSSFLPLIKFKIMNTMSIKKKLFSSFFHVVQLQLTVTFTASISIAASLCCHPHENTPGK